MTDLNEVANAEKKRRIKWGFTWAILCAVFWGLGYVPLQAIWGIDPLASLFGFSDVTTGYLVASLVDAFVQALMFAIVLSVVWAGVTGKLKDYARVITNVKISKWLFFGALFGGPCAIFGSALATGYIGADFAASTSLLSAVVGAIVARFVNKEKMSTKTILGILVLLVGGLIILNPINMINNINNPASADGIWLGYLGAFMGMIGWGVEGNIAVRALDVTDADVSLPVRFTVEAAFWIVILMPLTAVFVGFGTFVDVMAQTFTSVPFLFWMLMCALSLGFCYAAQYKAFPLIGVGRTLALCSLYVPVSLVALAVFLGTSIQWWVIIGSIIAIAGMFVMYWESGSLKDSNRDLGGEKP